MNANRSKDKPIIFVLGLSGAGKHHSSKLLSDKYSLQHFDLDREQYRKRIGLHTWDTFISQDCKIIATQIRSEIDDDKRGAILTFPTIYHIYSGKLKDAWREGIYTFLVWRPFELCWEARYKRQHTERGKEPPDCGRYIRLNLPTYEMYKSSEFNDFRIKNFEDNEAEPADDVLLDRILEALSKQKLDLACCANHSR